MWDYSSHLRVVAMLPLTQSPEGFLASVAITLAISPNCTFLVLHCTSHDHGPPVDLDLEELLLPEETLRITVLRLLCHFIFFQRHVLHNCTECRNCTEKKKKTRQHVFFPHELRWFYCISVTETALLVIITHCTHSEDDSSSMSVNKVIQSDLWGEGVVC